MRIGVYVGSFNPPHEGHHKVMQFLLEENLVDKVLILPTPNYWDKSNLVDIKERVAMLRFYEEENIIVDTKHNNFPYTYQVLRSLREDYPEAELYLVIGSDNLERLHEWKNLEEIFQNKVIVLKRQEIKKNPRLKDYEDRMIYRDDFDYVDVSSTKVRNGDNSHVYAKVKKYIKEHHLYENI